MRTGVVIVAAVMALAGCGDDEHKGTISHSTSATGQTTTAIAYTRLIYNPGTPLATARVADVFRARLQPIGVASSSVKIGGDIVHVDVPDSRLAAVKTALQGGRFDLYLFDDRLDPFATATETHASKFEVASETVQTKDGPTTLRYLVAPAAAKVALSQYIASHAGSAKALFGPIAAGYRSYFVQSGRSVRGELIDGAKASANGDSLALTFVGSGKSFLRWSSNNRARYVALVDGEVVGTYEATKEISTGVLVVTVVGDAAAMARALDGHALSHLTVLTETKALAPRSK